MRIQRPWHVVTASMLVLTIFLSGCSSNEDSQAGGSERDASAVGDSATFSGDKNSEYCDVSRLIFESSAGDTPEGLHTVVTLGLENGATMHAAAPREIAQEVGVFVDHLAVLQGAMLDSTDIEQDLTSESSELYSKATDFEFVQALATINQYNSQVCNVDIPDSDVEIPLEVPSANG